MYISLITHTTLMVDNGAHASFFYGQFGQRGRKVELTKNCWFEELELIWLGFTD